MQLKCKKSIFSAEIKLDCEKKSIEDKNKVLIAKKKIIFIN